MQISAGTKGNTKIGKTDCNSGCPRITFTEQLLCNEIIPKMNEMYIKSIFLLLVMRGDKL